MRLLFINPVHLPVLTESYLRDDFFFAMYLTYCLGKVQTRFFQWTVFTCFVAFVCFIVFCSIFVSVKEDAKIYFRCAIISVIFIFVWMMQSSITRSYKKVTPSIFTNDKCSELREAKFFDIQYNLDTSHLDAFDNEEKLPRMPYMEEPAEDIQNIDDQEFDDEQYPLVRRQQQRQTKDPFKVANKQE